MNHDRQQQVENIDQNSYKTVMLIGRSGDDKSPLINHLGGRVEGDHKVSLAELYISEKCNLNIIDTKGPDWLKKDKENRDLMKEVCQKTISFVEIALAAIIIVWCPLKDSHSDFQKTLDALKESFGEDVTKSCIFMIQGNWKPFAEIRNLGRDVPNEIKEINQLFPEIPVIEYDAEGSLDEQLPLLQEAIEKFKPYEKRQNHQITLAESLRTPLVGWIICVIVTLFKSGLLAVIRCLHFVSGLYCLTVDLAMKIWNNREKSLKNISMMFCFIFVLARFLRQNLKCIIKACFD